MISPLTLPSPVHRLNCLSRQWQVDLWAKRDDLIPQFFGGNKVRKAFGILSKMKKLPNVLITNGGSESNHARVVALMGAQENREVHLVLHGTTKKRGGNRALCVRAGAVLHHVSPGEVADKIAAIKKNQIEQGRTVEVIPGGGHTVEGAKAYAKAVSELPFDPDYIVHASGTGGTQAGLILGVTKYGLKAKILGVSVARLGNRGRREVEMLLPKKLHSLVSFDDRFRFGGYEQTTPELNQFISWVLKTEGIPMDPTYTGKAMYALAKMIDCGEIKRGSRVLFWHTGGLMNLLATEFH